MPEPTISFLPSSVLPHDLGADSGGIPWCVGRFGGLSIITDRELMVLELDLSQLRRAQHERSGHAAAGDTLFDDIDAAAGIGLE